MISENIRYYEDLRAFLTAQGNAADALKLVETQLAKINTYPFISELAA